MGGGYEETVQRRSSSKIDELMRRYLTPLAVI